MNPRFPHQTPPAPFYPGIPTIPSMMNVAPGQFPIPPMGNIMHVPVPIPPQIPGTMGITVPTGVATISAPPVRNIQPPSNIVLPQVSNSHKPPVSIVPVQTKPITTISVRPKPTGPPITVFVGNITERASDQLIRQMLAKCGQFANWKRVQGKNGAFGFCEYLFEESAMRAIRLLRDLQVADKKLVVNVDAKTQARLDKYIKEKNQKALAKHKPDQNDIKEDKTEDENKFEKKSDKTNNEEENSENNSTNGLVINSGDSSEKEKNKDDEKTQSESSESLPVAIILDEETLKDDARAMEEIQRILNDGRLEQKLTKSEPIKEQVSPRMDGPKPDNFADMDIDNEKKNLIHREIGKFRDTYKCGSCLVSLS